MESRWKFRHNWVQAFCGIPQRLIISNITSLIMIILNITSLIIIIDPSHAEAIFDQNTRWQRFLKAI